MIYIYIYIHIHTYIYINVYEQRHTKIGQGYTSIVCACMCVRVCTGVRVCACVCVRARACVRASAFFSGSQLITVIHSHSPTLSIAHPRTLPPSLSLTPYTLALPLSKLMSHPSLLLQHKDVCVLPCLVLLSVDTRVAYSRL